MLHFTVAVSSKWLCSFQVDGSAGSWDGHGFLAVGNRLRHLARDTQRDNWDDEGGVAIPPFEWQRAWSLCNESRRLGLPFPFMSPCGDGSVHLWWSAPDGREFRLEFKERTVLWSSRRPDGTFQYGREKRLQDAMVSVRAYLSK